MNNSEEVGFSTNAAFRGNWRFAKKPKRHDRVKIKVKYQLSWQLHIHIN